MKPWIAVGLVMCVGVALAGGRGAVRKQAEASLLVSGTLDIEPDGRVGGYTLDQAGALPEVATVLVDKAAPTWKFEPAVLNGKAVKASTRMSLRIVAKPIDEDNAEARIASAYFGGGNPGEFVTSKEVTPPRYPELAAITGARGTVYLVVRVGRDGTVEEVIAEQVNLRVIDTERGMTHWRNMLAKAALAGARKWTFNLPTEGEEVGKPFWLARVPVEFLLHDEEPTPYGKWEAYIPGPRQATPWLGSMDAALGADAVAGGSMQPIGSGPKLLTPLGGT